MNSVKRCLSILMLPALLLPLLCGEPQNPWNDPNNSIINAKRSLNGLPARVNMYQEYPCSVYIALPYLADSVVVAVALSDGGKTVLWRQHNLQRSDSAFSVTLTFVPGMASPVMVLLYRKNGTIDSLARAIQFRYPPAIAPAAPRTTHVMTPATVVFSVSDPDGDIHSCQIWIDSTTGQAVVPPLNRLNATTARCSTLVSSPRFDTVEVLAQAIDSAGNRSAFARCTVYVLDTVKPVLSFIRLAPSLNDSVVNKLPCSLFVKIWDHSLIDSVGYQENPHVRNPMSMISDSVALAILADLDSGANYYDVLAWDRAGNKGSVRVPIYYTGTVTSRFTFTGFVNRTVNENGSFPSIALDNGISLNPPPIGVPNWKEEVVWQILEGIPDGGIQATFSPATRTVSFAVPDSEWNGSESFTFIASWNNMATGNTSVIYTINPVNDPPRITWKSSCMKTAFDSLLVLADTCAFDPDHKANTLSWSQDTSRSRYFMLQFQTFIRTAKEAVSSAPQLIDPIIIIPLWNRTWKIVPKPGKGFGKDWTGSDTLRLVVSDGTLKDTADVIVRVTPTCR